MKIIIKECYLRKAEWFCKCYVIVDYIIMNNNQNDSKKPGDPFTNVSKRSIIGKKNFSF